MTVEYAYRILYTGVLAVIALLMTSLLVRVVAGPRITDRILCINMISTLLISTIILLSRLLGEQWLTDIALVYSMISFISVLVLAAVYIPRRPTRAKFGPEVIAEAALENEKGREEEGRKEP